MEHEKTCLEMVESYEWMVVQNLEEEPGATRVVVGGLAKAGLEICPALEEDFQRHKHVVLY